MTGIFGRRWRFIRTKLVSDHFAVPHSKSDAPELGNVRERVFTDRDEISKFARLIAPTLVPAQSGFTREKTRGQANLREIAMPPRAFVRLLLAPRT